MSNPTGDALMSAIEIGFQRAARPLNGAVIPMRTPNRVGIVIHQTDGAWCASLIHGCGFVARPTWAQASTRAELILRLADAM